MHGAITLKCGRPRVLYQLKKRKSYSLKEEHEIMRSFLKVGLGKSAEFIKVIVRARALEKEAQREKW